MAGRTPLSDAQRIEPRLTDIHLELMGELIVKWSRLEGSLESLIWAMLKLRPDDGRVVTSKLDAAPKVRMIRALMPRHIQEDAKRTLLIARISRVETLQEDRNFIVHGIWGTLIPDNIPIATSLRAKADPGEVVAKTYDAITMRSIIKETEAMADYVNLLADELEASRGKPPEPHAPG